MNETEIRCITTQSGICDVEELAILRDQELSELERVKQVIQEAKNAGDNAESSRLKALIERFQTRADGLQSDINAKACANCPFRTSG